MLTFRDMSVGRLRLSLALEAAVWTAAMAWLLFLVWDALAIFRTSGDIAWRNLLEIALLALLVYWPIIRVRVKHGYWMRDWDDVPPSATASDLPPRRPLPRSRVAE